MSKIYNAKEVKVSWGPFQLTDGALAEGTFCEVAPAARRATQTPLMGKGSVVSLMNNTTGTITVTLSASSDLNDELSDALNAQIESGIPDARAMQVVDHSGRTKHSCAKAVIDGFPTDTFSENQPVRQWVFLCPELAQDPRGSGNL